jgi:membrane-associated phospholipid phosphatase
MPGWLLAVLNFPSTLNDPIPSAVALTVWVVGILLVGYIRYRRKLPAASWFQAGIFLALTVMSSAGLNVVLDDIVGRPRPNPRTEHIQLHTPLVPFPTFPSGHTEHDVAYYGFLLYLSLTKPVREWRYHWLLLPLQIYAVFDILAIGYSRIWEGDHWLTDVLSGYLEGAIYLFFFIFLYRWTTDWFAKRRAKKQSLNITK